MGFFSVGQRAWVEGSKKGIGEGRGSSAQTVGGSDANGDNCEGSDDLGAETLAQRTGTGDGFAATGDRVAVMVDGVYGMVDVFRETVDRRSKTVDRCMKTGAAFGKSVNNRAESVDRIPETADRIDKAVDGFTRSGAGFGNRSTVFTRWSTESVPFRERCSHRRASSEGCEKRAAPREN